MKRSAAILACILLAGPAAAQWAPEVSLEKLAAMEIPAPSISTPRDGINYSGAEELLIMEFDITGVALDVPESEVVRQGSYYPNAFCFEHALRQALGDILENYKNPKGPLARTLSEIGASATPSKSELKTARQKVMTLLNSRDSLISLVRPYTLNQPPKGETVEKNWLFFTRLGARSYWTVVDRSGQNATYTYSID
jgi:hypothetical protein